MIFLGMIFEHKKYMVWGINIFDYLTLYDFILAPFRDSFVLYSIIIVICLYLLIFKIEDKYGIYLYKKSKSVGLIPWFIVTTLLFTQFSTRFAKWKLENTVKNSMLYSVKSTNNGDIMNGNIIGKAGNVIFFYCDNDKIAKILPVESIENISINSYDTNNPKFYKVDPKYKLILKDLANYTLPFVDFKLNKNPPSQ